MWTLKMERRDSLLNLTGCQVPCQQFKYNTKVVGTMKRKYLLDGMSDILDEMEDNSAHSIYVVRHYSNMDIDSVEEIVKYSSETFIAEVGGVVGIFLGLSFWGLYEIVALPLLKKAGLYLWPKIPKPRI